MLRESTWQYIQPALLAERRITRNDCAVHREARHVVGDHFLGFGERSCNNCSQMGKHGAKDLSGLSNVGIVIGNGRHGLLPLRLPVT